MPQTRFGGFFYFQALIGADFMAPNSINGGANMDLSLLWLVIAALGGAILAGLLGWAESSEDFNPRKFLSTILRGAVAALVAAVSYPYVGPVTVPILIGAVLAGAGVDVLGNRLAGSITTTGPTTTSPPK